MVGIKALKENGCDSLQEYFQRIIEHKATGELKEVKALAEPLNHAQRTHLLSFVWENPNISGEIAMYVADMLAELSSPVEVADSTIFTRPSTLV